MLDSVAQRRALAVLAALAFATILWLVHPVGIGLFFGALLAFTFQPLHRSMCRQLHRMRHGRRAILAAFACTTVATALVAGSLAELGYVIFGKGAGIVAALPAALAPDGQLARFFQRVASHLAPFGMNPGDLATHLRDLATQAALNLAQVAGALAGITFEVIITLLIVATTMFVVLARWPILARTAERVAPVAPRHTRNLLFELCTTGRHVMLGTIVTGAIQGILAGFVYALTNVPQAAFFGAMTAVASLLPLFGTMFVWVPLGIYLFMTGHPTAGIVEIAYCLVVVVGVTDYFLRAKLVGRSDTMRTYPTLIALFGGLAVFGAVGLVLGPVILAMALAVLRIYRREREALARRADAAPSFGESGRSSAAAARGLSAPASVPVMRRFAGSRGHPRGQQRVR